MRRNFVQILKSAKVDYKKEYKKLYSILYEKTIEISNFETLSLYQILNDEFSSFYLRGTCLTLQEFDEENGFSFPDPIKNDVQIDDLVLLMEYIYNLLIAYQGCTTEYDALIDVQFWLNQIVYVGNVIGYRLLPIDEFCVFVENDAVATAVAESDLIPEDFSYKIITYNYHSMRSNIEEKKSVIFRLASILEGKRKELEKINSNLASDLFYSFNNCNIRHNNCDSSIKGKYKPYIAEMKKDELGLWYDEIYQMCLLAFMELEQAERKTKFDVFKNMIEGNWG